VLSLDRAFALNSPRVSPRSRRAAAWGIPIAIGLVSLALLAGGFIADGLFAWASGLAFICHDSFMLLFVAWNTLPLARRPAVAPPAPPAPRPGMTVIVAAWNEADVLERTIGALLAQTEPPEHILIADDGSTDDTAKVLARTYGFALPDTPHFHTLSPAHPGIAWLRVPHGGKARALNRALTFVSTDIVVTVDADTLPVPSALAHMRDAFAADPDLVAATGVLIPVGKASAGGRVLECFQTCEYVRNFVSRYAWMRADSLLLVSGAFAGYRREAIARVGGFDPECLVEDYEIIHRLHRHARDAGLDWHVQVVGHAIARTSAPSGVGAFLRQRRRWFAGFLQTQVWNQDMIGNARYGHLGVWMLPVKTVDTVQPLLGLAATGTLITLVAGGRTTLASAILGIVAQKILVDMAFLAWCLHLYRRWTAHDGPPRYRHALLAAVLEPFSFQILRHLGAAMGWHHFLTGRRHWGKQVRHAMT